MATKNNFKFSTILKRSSCLNSVNENTKVVDSQTLYEHLEALMKNTKNGREQSVQCSLKSYLESLCNLPNASKYYWQPVSLIEKFNKIDKVISDRIVSEYTNRVLPYVQDIESIEYCIERSDLMDDQKSSILESAKNYQAAERILSNHQYISKRFNIENAIVKYNFIGPKAFCESVASLIDTYRIKPYQRFNASIDECCYILEKAGQKYDKMEICRNLLEYYLLREEYITDIERDNFEKVINTNIFLLPLNGQKPIFDIPKDNNSIRNSIDNFIFSKEKNGEILSNLIIDSLSKTSKIDITNNIDKLFFLLWDVLKSETIPFDEFYNSLNGIMYKFSLIADNAVAGLNDYTHKDISDIVNKIHEVKNHIKTDCRSNSELTDYGVKFVNSIDKCLNKFIDAKNIIYSEPNLQAINFVNRDNYEDAIPLKEFKIFKFHNLVRAAFNIDKLLSKKEKRFANKTSQKAKRFIKKVKNTLFESADKINIYSYIGEDNKVDICVGQYIYNEHDLSDDNLDIITDFVSEVCNEFNDILACEGNETTKAYYMINPGVAEIRLKESTPIRIEKEDIVNIIEAEDHSFDVYANRLSESNFIVNLFNQSDCRPLMEQFEDIDKYDNFTIEHYKCALEALSYFYSNNEEVLEFADIFSKYHHDNMIEESASSLIMITEDRIIKDLAESWNHENIDEVPLEIKLEAFSLLQDILIDAGKPIYEESMVDNWDDEDEEDSSNDKKEKATDEKKDDEVYFKKPTENDKSSDNKSQAQEPDTSRKKQGFNLHGLKLGLKGLRDKFKKMNTSMKEKSKNLDNSVRSMVKGFKDSQSNQRREQIIKGSVIPSFSRILATGALMAGSAIIDPTHIVTPAIIALGGFAINNHLTKKEKILILDEIETELEVVDKEIGMAEGESDMKKYRALLRYKKELQRQYQRIRYNIRVGKDILPGSDVGLKHPD